MTGNAFIRFRAPGQPIVCEQQLTAADGSALVFGDIVVKTWLGILPDASFCRPERESTAKDDYIQSAADAVDKLKSDGGKTVMCRQICGKFGSFDPETLWNDYTALFPDMFCFLIHTPQTGWWMGATPELLVRKSDRGIETRALAGTRRFNGSLPWDGKNLREHAFVIDDIRHRASEAGFCQITIDETATLRYGGVEHLSTPIYIMCDNDDSCAVGRLIDAIHPTAAIAGYPCSNAIDEIARLEHRPRKLYGGYIRTPDMTYVVLRCVHFDSNGWCIYTGSGLTAESDPEDEWNETQAKAEPLLKLLTNR